MSRKPLSPQRAKLVDACQIDMVHICRQFGHELHTILQHDHRRDLFPDRIKVAHALAGRGYSTPVIGLAMGRDHSTVIYWLKPEEYRANRRMNCKVRSGKKAQD